MYGFKGKDVVPSGPLISKALKEDDSEGVGVRTAAGGIDIGARPMLEIWPLRAAEVVNVRAAEVEAASGRIRGSIVVAFVVVAVEIDDEHVDKKILNVELDDVI
jgi:hypothetical protein